MGRWKMGPNGGYYDQSDSGTDQYQPTPADLASQPASSAGGNAGPGAMVSGAAPSQGYSQNGPAMGGMVSGPAAAQGTAGTPNLPAAGPSNGDPVYGQKPAWMDDQTWARISGGLNGNYGGRPDGGPGPWMGENPNLGPGGANGGTLEDILKKLQEFYTMQRGGMLGAGAGGAAGAGGNSSRSGGRMALGALGGLFR